MFAFVCMYFCLYICISVLRPCLFVVMTLMAEALGAHLFSDDSDTNLTYLVMTEIKIYTHTNRCLPIPLFIHIHESRMYLPFFSTYN